jgi:hypothetical protein
LPSSNGREFKRRVRAWIAQRFSRDLDVFSEAFLFGSLVHEVRAARDVDVLLVARTGPGTGGWTRARTAVQTWKTEFGDVSSRPISITLLTESEWREVRAWFAPEREQLAVSGRRSYASHETEALA